jgi:hypothetical protein
MVLFFVNIQQIDSIRTSQHFVIINIATLIINVNGHAEDQRDSNKDLQLANILGSRILGALDNIETDTITLSQRFKTFALNC